MLISLALTQSKVSDEMFGWNLYRTRVPIISKEKRNCKIISLQATTQSRIPLRAGRMQSQFE
jgi:hypothetical protein